MGDKVKALKKDNDDLKSQLNDLKKEFQFLKSKMAEQKDYNENGSHGFTEHTGCAVPQRQLWCAREVGIQFVKSSG